MQARTKQLKERGWPRFDSRERAWWAVLLAVLAVLGVACWLALLFGRTDLGQGVKDGARNRSSAANPQQPSATSATEQANRGRAATAVYAYSVIPGGVRSVAQLKSAIARDPVVSAEYANFRLENARVVQLDEDRSVYVAYRVGARVFWTSRRVRIGKGETVLTDGVETSRAKCGNLISEELQPAVSPNEPTEVAMNTPIDVHYDPGGPETDDRFPGLSAPPPSNVPPASYESPIYEPPYSGPPAGGTPWSGGAEPIFPVVPPPIANPQRSQPPSSPVVNTPEPGTGVQFFLAAVAILLLFLLRRVKSDQHLEGNGGTR